MNELSSILADQVDRLLADHAGKEVLEAAERGQFPDDLWRAIEDNGLTRVLLPEARGGVGGDWRHAEIILRAAGRYQTPVPLAEAVLATWLLGRAGLEVPDGVLGLAPCRQDDIIRVGDDGRISGLARRVPWAGNADHLAVVAELGDGHCIALVERGNWDAEAGRNIAAEPRGACRFAGAVAASAPLPNDLAADVVFSYGALVRSVQIAGALEFLLQQSVQYANDRVQFGRPIGKFQAVQQELARLAGEVAAAGAAAELACRAAETGDAAFEIAVAKQRCSEAATVGAAIAHQAHGAIGFTYEHALHFATRRLWSWRAEFGSETYWAGRLGAAMLERGPANLWRDLTAR